MTITDEAVEETTAPEVETEESSEDKTPRRRDFSVVRSYHEELAAFVNERSGLDPISANQIKAVLTLRTDFGNTDDQKAARDARKAARAAEAVKYEGLSPEQVKATKALARAETQAEKLRKRADETLARARELAANPVASGEDLQEVVESASEGTEAEEAAEKPRRGLGRRR